MIPFPNHRLLRGRILLPVCAILISAVALALALLARRQLAGEARLEIVRAVGLQRAVNTSAGEAAPACSAEVGYAQALPPSVSLDKLVQGLQDSAKAFDVSIKSVSGEPHAQTARTLAALEVNIALHGAYPGIKAALAEGLARFPTGTLTHLHLKREGSALPPMEDATVQVTFALRPVGPGPLDCNLAPPGVDVRETVK